MFPPEWFSLRPYLKQDYDENCIQNITSFANYIQNIVTMKLWWPVYIFPAEWLKNGLLKKSEGQPVVTPPRLDC